jgi:hypothetical protein
MYLFLKHSEGYVLCGNTIPFSEEKKKNKRKKDEGTIFVRGERMDENGGDFREFLSIRTQALITKTYV